MEHIQQIEISQLELHRLQSQVYGEEVIEDDFINDIRLNGVINPLIVSNRTGNLVILSGHRRYKASLILGLITLPCIVRNYENEDVEDIIFLASNMNREKTLMQRTQEFLHYRNVLKNLAKYKQEKALANVNKGKKARGGEISTTSEDEIFNDELAQYLSDLNLSNEEPLDMRKILSERTGFSEHYQKMLTWVFENDFSSNQFAKWEKKGLHIDTKISIDSQWQELRDKVNNNTIKLSEAFNQVKNLIEETNKSFEKAPKKEKKEKAFKEEKVIKIDKGGEISDAIIDKVQCFDFDTEYEEIEYVTNGGHPYEPVAYKNNGVNPADTKNFKSLGVYNYEDSIIYVAKINGKHKVFSHEELFNLIMQGA